MDEKGEVAKDVERIGAASERVGRKVFGHDDPSKAADAGDVLEAVLVAVMAATGLSPVDAADRLASAADALERHHAAVRAELKRQHSLELVTSPAPEVKP